MYAAPPHVAAAGYVLSPHNVDVAQASASRPSLAAGSQQTADLGGRMGTQGINVGVKGRLAPDHAVGEQASGDANVFSAGSLHKMNSNQMLDLQEEMQGVLRSERD